MRRPVMRARSPGPPSRVQVALDCRARTPHLGGTSNHVPFSMSPMQQENGHGPAPGDGTTILAVRKGGRVVVAGDGQVTAGNTVMKGGARKVRRLSGGAVIAGFAGATADALALFERLEAKLEKHP